MQQLPKARVLTLDHGTSLVRTRLIAPIRDITAQTLAVAAGLWPLTATVGLLWILALAMTYG